MPEAIDGFDSLYAERLWQLLPEVYRNADAPTPGGAGPLRELIERIGGQVAVARRGVDRLWADASIETCQDWVIPYLGDLVGANLVNNLDPRAQRLDVAKTIHYRRRKGTLQLAEELARDLTGWTAHAVEAFRGLARTRHGLDPALGPGALPGADPGSLRALLAAEHTVGPLTGTPAGGYLDLRCARGAALTTSAFDEAAHTADVRAGRGAAGHYDIATLLVFIWRLRTFVVRGGTPVPVAGEPGSYSFDPTGREVPLFVPAGAPGDVYSPAWRPIDQTQAPGPLTPALLTALQRSADGAPVGVGPGVTVGEIRPRHGRFRVTGALPAGAGVDYVYASAAAVGAGPYDRSIFAGAPKATGVEHVVSAGAGLDTALLATAGTGTVTIGDSRTYTAFGAPRTVTELLVRAGEAERPVVRPPAGGAPWVFVGRPGATLTLDGLTVSGCDIVLRGPFASVRLSGCTVDPGRAAQDSPPLAHAVDGRRLHPTRVWIESDPQAPGGIAALAIDRCILGPVRTRYGGSVRAVAVSDSVLQGIREASGIAIADPLSLAHGLLAGAAPPGAPSHGYPVAAAILAAVPGLAHALAAYLAATPDVQRQGLSLTVRNALDTLLAGPSMYNPALFADVPLSPLVRALAAVEAPAAAVRVALNEGLVEDAFPYALGVAALAVAGAEVSLNRVTVLGRTIADRLTATDSILAGFTTVADRQAGRLRCCAYPQGSVVPAGESVAATVPASSPFVSEAFGDPGYAQVLETADTTIGPDGAQGASLTAGATTGSEMGAFSAELAPLKEAGLLAKYAEYMPLGLTPVIVHVT